MSRLEKKLDELEYFKIRTIYNHYDDTPYIYYEKQYCYNVTICITLYDNEIDDYHLENDYSWLSKQQAIDNLQEAFNIMQKDLEELKEYEFKDLWLW